MKLPYTPMVDALTNADEFYVQQNGQRRLAKVAHVATVVAAEVAADSAPQIQAVSGAITAEAKARADAITTEAQARTAADKLTSEALAEEAKARVEADKALQARIVSMTGTLSLPAGLSLAVGKTERKVAVAGLKKGDVLSITPDKALPGGMSLGDAYCLVDGELTLATLFTGLLGVSLSAATTIALSIRALR